MKPIEFPEANNTLQKPAGWTDEDCGPLPVFSDGKQSVSLWRPTWRERISVLVFGRVWLSVFAGSTQPPVSIWGTRRVFHGASVDHP